MHVRCPQKKLFCDLFDNSFIIQCIKCCLDLGKISLVSRDCSYCIYICDEGMMIDFVFIFKNSITFLYIIIFYIFMRNANIIC